MKKNTLVFVHGLESTAQGTKGRFFARHFPGMVIEDFTGDFSTRMKKLQKLLANKNNLILVGSSYGGLMAVQYAMEHEEKIKKLILLAPALNLPEFQRKAGKTLKIPTIIYHGTNDEVVNPGEVKKIADEIFVCCDYHLVEDDHPLRKTFTKIPWAELLETV
jgi:pimeloyl-ACP methyl ester carboxylesterase